MSTTFASKLWHPRTRGIVRLNNTDSHSHVLQTETEDILELRWLHEIRIGELDSAAATMLKLDKINAGDGGPEGEHSRLQCLSQLALLATKPISQRLVTV